MDENITEALSKDGNFNEEEFLKAISGFYYDTLPDGGYKITAVKTRDSSEQVIPYGVTVIGDRVFKESKWGTDKKIVIPDSVTHIGQEAFAYNDHLSEVEIGTGVRSIAADAFARCEKLRTVHIADIGTWCKISFENNASNPIKYGSFVYLNRKPIKDPVLPDWVEVINDRAFNFWSYVGSFTLPEGVKRIGKEAFTCCWGLNSINLPESLTEMGEGALSGCIDLKEIILPRGLTKIPDKLFQGCIGLTKVTIPEKVTEIGKHAFQGCSGIREIDLPQTLTVIEDGLLEWAQSLESIDIPPSVDIIGNSALASCTKLTKIKLPESVTIVRAAAFKDCTELRSITIPRGMRAIAEDAFAGCTTLINVFYGGTKKEWRGIHIDKSNKPLLKAKIHFDWKE